MKALRWHNKGDVRVDDIDTPRPGDDEVLVKVTYSGICGSEVHEFAAGPIFIPLEPHPLTKSTAPQTLGHEFGGEVVEVGKEVRDIAVGDYVTVNPVLACGSCPACQRGRPALCDKLAYYGLIGDGGHAEFSRIKAANCVKVPSDVPSEYVAFGEPAGVAYHAIRLGGVTPGSTVAVLGGGPIGQLAVQYARRAGAEKIIMTEIAPARINYAKEIGAVDHILNPVEGDVLQNLLDMTDGQGVDFSIECSGGNKTGLLEDTAAQAIEFTRPEGTTVIVGTFAEPSELHFNNIVLLERRVIGAWVWHTQQEYQEAMQLIIDEKVQVLPLITGKVSLDRAVDDGIQELQMNKDEHVKILVDLTT